MGAKSSTAASASSPPLISHVNGRQLANDPLTQLPDYPIARLLVAAVGGGGGGGLAEHVLLIPGIEQIPFCPAFVADAAAGLEAAPSAAPGELLERCAAGPLVSFARRARLHGDEEIAAAAAAHVGHALAAKTQRVVPVCVPSGDLDLVRFVEGTRHPESRRRARAS